jgi:TRAP-type C4-dicarboxylate transport system permease small subunit
MELLVNRLPAGGRRQVERFVALLAGLFGALCAWHGARLAASVVNTLPATGWSAAWQYVPAAAGGLLIALAALLRLAPGTRGAGESDEGVGAAG